MKHTIRMKRHPAVFYMRYGKKVVVYQTEQKKVFTFNETAGDILDRFGTFTSVDEAIEKLSDLYEVSDKILFRDTINDFVAELLAKEVLVREYVQDRSEKRLEKEAAAYAAEEGRLHSVTFELTYKCNERCRHCYVSSEHRAELTTEKIKGVLDELAEMGVFGITFTGGELFTRGDVFEVLEYAYKRHLLIDIFTNGSLLNGDDCCRLKAIYPRCIHFSVYSHVAEKHDAITKMKGSFEKTIQSIRNCVLMQIPVNIKMPVFTETLADMDGMVSLANSLGVSVEMGNNITPKTNGDLMPTVLKLMDEESDKMFHENLRRLMESEDLGEEESRSEKLCGAGERSLSISPYGDVYPCNVLRLPLGNVCSDSIEHIWKHSENLSWWRKNNLRKSKIGCGDCKWMDRCNFCPGEAMMRTGNPLAKYSAACRFTEYGINREKGGKG